MFTLIVFTLLWTFFKSLHLIYLFQIKEYRFDRFFSFFREVGYGKVLYESGYRLPAITIRNILLVVINMVTVMLLLLLSLELPEIYYGLTAGLPFAPFIALLITMIGVTLTTPLAWITREIKIQQAKTLIHDTDITFIGITGSYGKTSVKEYLYHILNADLKVAKTPKNMNSDIGVAQALLTQIKPETTHFVVEVGAYRSGEIMKAAHYIPLKYAVLTGLGNQHLDLYGSREVLITEESSLLYQLPESGTAYINYEVPNRVELEKSLKCNVVTYGLDKKADIWLQIKHSDAEGQTAEIKLHDESLTIKTSLLGAHTLLNLLPAIAIARELKLSIKTITHAVSTLSSIPGKLKLLKGAKKSTVLDDSANTNLNGFLAAIDTIKQFPQPHKVIISQGIIELGVEKRQSYAEIIAHLEKYNIELHTTDKLFGELTQSKRVVIYNDVKQLVNAVMFSLDKKSIVLVEGKFPPNVLQTLAI
ncbi:MAG: Mur ligase family protein [Weeksellaceae bacterium]